MNKEEIRNVLDNHKKWLSDNGGSIADLQKADLREADLRGADLSQANGIETAIDWLKKNFKTNNKGFIVYKAIGATYYTLPKSWDKIKIGDYYQENVNFYRTEPCGCGVNFATLDWIKREFRHKIAVEDIKVRRCYLHWEDLADIVVPYNTDGKARCAKLEKGKIIKVKIEEN